MIEAPVTVFWNVEKKGRWAARRRRGARRLPGAGRHASAAASWLRAPAPA